jgi:hypothetical protein
LRIARSLASIGLIVSACTLPAFGWSGDEPKPATPPTQEPARAVSAEDPVYLFLNAPTDLDAFWKLIARPDRVILGGSEYRKLLQSAETGKPAETRPTGVIEALTATGQVVGDCANLTLEFRVVLESAGPAWVSLRLDGLTLTEARERSADLPTRIVEDRGWQVELRGKGEHLVRVGLIAPVKSTVEGKRLEILIPPVASTAIDLGVPQTVVEASTGLNELLAIAPAEPNRSGTRLQARLSPRSKLELSWRERVDPASKLPPLLEATGDVAVDVERDSILTRSTWDVSSIRGTVGQITLRLDPTEEVLDVLVESKPVMVEARRDGGRSLIVVPLTEPLRPGTSRSLTLSTRRPIAAEGTVRAILEGYSFDQTKVQSGMIAISRTGPLFLNPTSSRGLRRIDPRTELPDSLRTRADTVLAYEFNGPPFELVLRIEPAPPRLRIEERTTVTIDPRSARILTRLDCRPSQGKVFDVQVLLPKGLDFEGAESPDGVGPVRVVPLDQQRTLGVGLDVPRILSISLTPQAREHDSFVIVLKGWCSIDPSNLVSVPLFRPVVDSSPGGRFAVVTDRNVSVELAPMGDEPANFRVDWGQPPVDWVWPNRKPGTEQSLLWLRSDANPETLPLRATVRPRSIRHETTLTATIDRKGAEVVEEITGEVAFGSLSKLDLTIPPEVADRWEIEGVERTIREPLETEADGSRRYRLKFPRDFADTFRLRIRYHLPFTRSHPNETGGRVNLSPIRVLEGISTGRKVLIAAEPSVDVQADAKGWSSVTFDATSSPESGLPIRMSLTRQADDAGSVVVTARPGPQMPLPGVVVSRLWIKTVQQSDNGLASSAYFWVESRESSMLIGLAPGTVWVRARVGTTELGEGSVDLVRPDEYRLKFPSATPSGPILVAIDTIAPASAAVSGWPAPRLLGSGVIQQTVWEAQLLGTRAGVGTPSGWVDENQWSWDGLIWQRRPWKSPAELATWLTGGNTRYRLAESLDQEDRGNRHSYLFSRVGPPSTLQFAVFSRFTLLLLCSGPVLVAGLLVLSKRPPPRMVSLAGLIVAFGLGALVDPSVLILILQSSTLGVLLFLTALLIHWAIDRRNPRGAVGDLGMIVPASSVGSTFDRAPGVGSDDSTAIRVRPTSASSASTADHIVISRTLGGPLHERSPSEPDL